MKSIYVKRVLVKVMKSFISILIIVKVITSNDCDLYFDYEISYAFEIETDLHTNRISGYIFLIISIFLFFVFCVYRMI